MTKILVTGARGMLATDFIRIASGEYEIVSCDRDMLDITNISNIRTVIEREMPDIVLNCAAYTNVDESEDTGKMACFDINTLGVYHLAKVTHELGVDLITISTDYVFDGKNPDLYHEDDDCNPLGIYGLSKYLGEQLAHDEHPDAIIIRTSWLYGGDREHKNFVNTMLALADNQSDIRVVSDQFGSPTYTIDLSYAILTVVEQIDTYRGHILHLSNETPGHGISRYEFAEEIYRLAGKNTHITPCTSAEFLSKAVRPQYSKLQNTSTIKLRDWHDGLSEYISSVH